LAGGASGKLFDFIKVGRPIIASNTPGIKQIVECEIVGKSFETKEQIEDMINLLDLKRE
jgi:hypothetical protein